MRVERFTPVAILAAIVLGLNACASAGTAARTAQGSPARQEPTSSGEGRVPCRATEAAPADPFVPPTHLEDGRVVLPVTFPDGTTAQMTYPSSLDLAGLGAFVRTSGQLAGEAETGRDLTVVRGDAAGWEDLGEPVACYAAPDGEQAELLPVIGDPDTAYRFRFHLSGWTAFTWEGNAGASMTDDQRARWANSLWAEVSPDGWPILRTRDPLVLGPESWGDVQVELGDVGHRAILMWPVECEATPSPGSTTLAGRIVDLSPGEGSNDQWFASWCLPDAPMVIHLYGDRPFLDDVVRGLEVRSVRHTFPSDRYHIVP